MANVGHYGIASLELVEVDEFENGSFQIINTSIRWSKLKKPRSRSRGQRLFLFPRSEQRANYTRQLISLDSSQYVE